MAAPQNQAAWLTAAGKPLNVADAPMPVLGPDDIVVKNAAVAINPLDCHMQDLGVFVQQWPAIFGCDVAGEVHEVGSNVTRFAKGDRVIGHAINLVTGRPQDGAYALYTTIPSNKAALLPESISYTDGVVMPFAIEAAVCVLNVDKPGVAMPGVSTPALGLPYPTLGKSEKPTTNKTLVVYGGSSSVGLTTTQLATAAGLRVITVTGPANLDLSRRAGAAVAIDRTKPAEAIISAVVDAVRASPDAEFVGIFDAVATEETYAHDLEILDRLGGGHLACVHPPPAGGEGGLPENVKAGMIFAVNDAATPVWEKYVTPALESGELVCMPRAEVVGKGLGAVDEALKRCRAGVSATKLVVEL